MKVAYYQTISGRSPVEEFIGECSESMYADFLDAVELLEQGLNLEFPLSRPLFGIHPGLYELRLKDATGKVRIFYYVKKGNAIYMLHAFRKKTQALPRREVEVAIKRLKEV